MFITFLALLKRSSYFGCGILRISHRLCSLRHTLPRHVSRARELQPRFGSGFFVVDSELGIYRPLRAQAKSFFFSLLFSFFACSGILSKLDRYDFFQVSKKDLLTVAQILWIPSALLRIIALIVCQIKPILDSSWTCPDSHCKEVFFTNSSTHLGKTPK